MNRNPACVLPHNPQIERDVADTSGTNLQAGIDAATSAMMACRACMEANKTSTENRVILITDAQVGRRREEGGETGGRGGEGRQKGGRSQGEDGGCLGPPAAAQSGPLLAACHHPLSACSPTRATSPTPACWHA